MLLGAGGCGCGARKREQPGADEAATRQPPPASQTAAADRGAIPPLPALPPRAADDLPPETADVWWTVQPTGATLRITAPNGRVSVLEARGRVSITLPTDFYDIDITHPDCEPWSRRLALGGSVTNQEVALTPRSVPPPARPVPPATPEEIAAAIAAAEPVAPLLGTEVDDAVPAPGTTAAAETPPGPDEPPAVPSVTSGPREAPPAVAVTEQPPERAAEALVTLAPPAPRPDRRPLTLATLEAPDTAPVVATPPAVAEPAEAPPAVAATPVAVPRPEPAPDLGRVRIVVASTVPNDEALPLAAKHLRIGGSDIRPLHLLSAELPRSVVGRNTVSLRVARYDVTPAVQTLPAQTDDDVAELVFQAVPHPVTVSLTGLPANADVWELSGDGRMRRMSGASRALLLTPFKDYDVEVRAPGLQPARVALRGTKPGTALPDLAVRLLPPPYSARPGQHCRIDLGQGTDMDLVWVPGGRLVMTDPRHEGVPPDVREETVPRGFWMAATEVTERQWAAVMGTLSANDADGALPKTDVSWVAANLFAQRLGRLVPRGAVRLPTEAEWEQAARADSGDALGGVPAAEVHHAGNSRGRPRAASVGAANAFGLLNMAGNVREWCADYYASYRGGVVAGPARRVVRGGGFRSARDDCRGDVRDAAPPDVALPDLGLRIVLQLGLPPAS
jgi:hypothetical protein